MSETHLHGEVMMHAFIFDCLLGTVVGRMSCQVAYVIGVSHKLAMCTQPGKEASWRCELVGAVRSVCAIK